MLFFILLNILTLARYKITIQVAMTIRIANCQSEIDTESLYETLERELPTPKDEAKTNKNISTVNMNNTNSGVLKALTIFLAFFCFLIFRSGSRLLISIFPINIPTKKYSKQYPKIHSS